MTRLIIPRAGQPQGVVRPNRAHFFGAECDYLWTPGNDGGKIPKVRTFNGLAGVPNTSFNTGTSRNLGLRPWCSVLVMTFPSATQSGTLFNAGNNTGGARLVVGTGGSSIQLNWVANTVGGGTNQLVETGITAFNKIAGVLVTNWTASGQTSWFKRPGKPVFTFSDTLAIVSPTDFSVVLSAAGTIGMELAAISSGILNATQVRSLLENPWQIVEPLARNSRVRAASGGSTTITGAIGTAVASGLTGTVNANRTISGALGTATATGFLGVVNANRTISGALGTAVASGLAGNVYANRTIAGALGTATASGFQGAVTNGNTTTITGSLGTAVATGFTGGVAWNRYIAGLLGVATASGFTGGVANGTVVTGRRRTSQRKILVTIKGARFLVPEDQLDEWLDDKEEELVEQAIKPVTVVSKKARVIRANTSPVPKVAAQADEAWVAAAVAELNRRVQQRIADERKRLQDEDDEEVMLLLL